MSLTSAVPRFASEAKLVSNLSRLAAELARRQGGTWVILNEHDVTGRIVDISALRLDVQALRSRVTGDCVRPLSEPELRALRSLRSDRAVRLATLARHLRLAEPSAARIVRGLLSDGLVERTPTGGFLRAVTLKPIVDRVLTFEAKLSDWRKALLQARTHQSFADFAYVAFDAAFKRRFERGLSAYARQGVGLFAIAANGGGASAVLPSRRSAANSTLLRALNAERTLARLLGYKLNELPESRLPSASAGSGRRELPRLLGPRAKTVMRLVADSVRWR